jgi:hypothetical protein
VKQESGDAADEKDLALCLGAVAVLAPSLGLLAPGCGDEPRAPGTTPDAGGAPSRKGRAGEGTSTTAPGQGHHGVRMGHRRASRELVE